MPNTWATDPASTGRTEGRRTPSLTFLGAAGTVTGSCFAIDTATQRVLVDCGQFQGPKELRRRNWAGIGVGPASVDAVVLTHAHVDHCGMLAVLVRDGFRGPIFCTPSTAELVSVVLPDSGRLAEEEARFANRQGYSRHSPALPLFTERDALRTLDSLVTIPFGVHHDRHDWGFTLGRAGHILGSAWVHVTIDGGDHVGRGSPRSARHDDGRSSIVFSGDLGRGDHPLLLGPEPCPPADVVVIESTYGDRDHPLGDPAQQLADVVNETTARGGSVVIPAFAVDRTDMVLYQLGRLRAGGVIPDVPIFLDSPMATTALAIYADAIRSGAPDVRPDLVGSDPFAIDGLSLIANSDESKRLNSDDRPMIIISASGMLTGGRVLHHVARRIEDERNSIVLVGYQASGTRGRRLVDGEPKLRMFGRDMDVRAQIVEIDTMSVHADRNELVDWLRPTAERLSVAHVVHGEPSASSALARLISTQLGVRATVPSMDETACLTSG